MAGSGTAHLRPTGEVLLSAQNVVVEFPVGKTGMKVHAVSDVSVDVKEGETLGLVGESGCGKSTTGRALMQLPRPTGGEVLFQGNDLTTLVGDDLRRVRPEMQMIFQDPISSLNPRRKVSDIVGEPLKIWASETHPPGTEVRLASSVIFTEIGLRFLAFAFLVLTWIIFDGVRGLLSLTYDSPAFYQWLKGGGLFLFASALIWGVVLYVIGSNVRDRQPNGRYLQWGETAFSLLVVLLILRNGGDLGVTQIVAVLSLLLSLIASVLLALPGASKDFKDMADVRAEHVQIVRRTMEDVGIDPDAAWDRRPHQFSGGQCQRLSIARALVLNPKLIICDEPVSALDVSVQAQILNLLEDMKERYGLTLVFIAHDLAVVKNVSDRVAVMYLGKLCEVAPPDDLYNKPAHPYTAALLGSIPVPDPTFRPTEENVLGGEIPSPLAPPSGCRFRTRCPRAQDMCAQVEPKMRQVGLGHYVACHFPLDVTEEQRNRR